MCASLEISARFFEVVPIRSSYRSASSFSSSPRKNGSREVEKQTKLGRSRIERVKGGNRVRTWESKRKEL